MKNIFLFICLHLLFCVAAIAQQSPSRQFEKCGMDYVNAHAIAENPALAEQVRQHESFVQQWIKDHKDELRQPSGNILTIPVVVHVVSYVNNSASNISDAQIESQIVAMNEVFRRTNENAQETPAMFLPVAADMEIEFCLARRDPDGFPTNGITRTFSDSSDFSTDAMKFDNQGGKNGWPTNRYLNIWVVNRLHGGIVLGYAYIPGNAPNAAVDGLAIQYNVFGTTGALANGYDYGLTACHEIGHWLSLYHPWGPGNEPQDPVNCTQMCAIDDFVDDTPRTCDANYSCISSVNSCSNETPDLPDMVQNYMDYGQDQCLNLFTLGQRARARATLSFGGAHYSVAQNSIACEPIPQGANDVRLVSILSPTVQPGQCTQVKPIIEVQNFGTDELFFFQVQYTMDGVQLLPETWFEFDIQPLETVQIELPPINTVANGIIHNLTVTLINPNNQADFSTDNNSASVAFATIGIGAALPYAKNFDNGALPNNWTVSNPDNATTFAANAGTGYNGSSNAIVIHNFTYNNAQGQIDYINLDKIDLANTIAPALQFYAAYAPQTDADISDMLEVLISTDCGASYQSIASYSGAELISVDAPSSQAFVPNGDDQWKLFTIPLNAYKGVRTALFRIRQTRGTGNNLYIDELRVVSEVVGTPSVPANSPASVRILPNPASNQTTLQWNSAANTSNTIEISNIAGAVLASHRVNAVKGENQFSLPLASLPKGIYLVKITAVGGGTMVQKMVVAEGE